MNVADILRVKGSVVKTVTPDKTALGVLTAAACRADRRHDRER